METFYFLNQTFNSFNEFEEFKQKYEKLNNVVLVIDDCHKNKGDNADIFKYLRLTLLSKAGQERRSVSKGIRTSKTGRLEL